MSSSGSMWHRLAFDAPTVTPNGQGGEVVGWAETFLAYGEIKWLRGGETVIAARLAGRQPAVIRIHLTAAALLVDPEWRMRDVRSGDVFNIRSIVPSDDRQYLELTAERGVAQ